jgi:hypothetical protein
MRRDSIVKQGNLRDMSGVLSKVDMRWNSLEPKAATGGLAM